MRSSFRSFIETVGSSVGGNIETTEAASGVALKPQNPSIGNDYVKYLGKYEAIFKKALTY
jgi:hypothetical protein